MKACRNFILLNTIKQFFSAELALDNSDDPQHSLQLACAALLIELARADFQQDDNEQQAIEGALLQCFDLSDGELSTLIELAEQENREATSLYQFTSLIKDHYTPEQRFELVTMLWQVAVADGNIDKYEEHFIRKVADLIYLPHSEFIRTKLSVLG